MIETRVPDQGFASLAELQERHSALVKAVGKDIIMPANLVRIAQFIRKSVATGAVLDSPADRAAAQSLISFWTTRLASASRDLDKEGRTAQIPEFEDTLLAEFNPDSLVPTVIAPTDRWLDQQSPADQTLARRLLIRLISLREDGTFGVAPGISGVCEDLEPRDRAEEILAQLVGLGVVRSTRNLSGYEEYAIQSAELLNRWPRLQQWMAMRKRFREKAMLWAQRRAEKGADPSRRPLLQRMDKAIERAVQEFGGWVETHRTALLASLNIRDTTEEFLSEKEYEEAEAYRDRNPVELRLVYQKRQHDRERQQRRQARSAALVAVAVVVLATLSVLGIRGWKQAESDAKVQGDAKQKAVAALKDQQKIAVKRDELQRAATYYEMGAESEADDWDTSGAFLWYAQGWPRFEASADVLKPEDRERLRTRYLFQLATARERLPVLSGMAYHKGMLASARTADGRCLLTIGGAEAGEKAPPLVRIWRWSEQRGRAEWKSSTLPWGRPAPRHTLAQPAAYVSPNGRFAVVTGVSRDETLTAASVWDIPEVGEAGPARELKVYAGDAKVAAGRPDGRSGEVTAAGFSPDGQLFAAVIQQANRRRLFLWRSGRWDDPQELESPDGVGQFGQFAFCTTPSGNRLAVAVESAPPTSGYERLVCLEWSLDKPSLEPPRRYKLLGQFPVNSQQGSRLTQILVAYKPDGSVLLVSNGWQSRPWSDVWLFNSKKDFEGREAVPEPAPGRSRFARGVQPG